jgi:hypothetical protein
MGGAGLYNLSILIKYLGEPAPTELNTIDTIPNQKDRILDIILVGAGEPKSRYKSDKSQKPAPA